VKICGVTVAMPQGYHRQLHHGLQHGEVARVARTVELSRSRVPKRYVVVPEIPRTATGKVSKARTRRSCGSDLSGPHVRSRQLAPNGQEP
jgi:acyl-CoA synthetase (AMP-forming)/AMP-acid ligase II